MAALCTALALTACSGPATVHTKRVRPPAPTAPPATTPAPVPTPSLPPVRSWHSTHLTLNPLTGLPPVPRGPVVGVKIDDTTSGAPQSNVDAADVVYVEPVEAGLTRLMVVYAGRRPGVVGPVRSIRLGDPRLVGSYGPIALAYSGGASGVLASVHRTKVVDGSADVYGGLYHRGGGNPAPYDLMLDLRALAGTVHSAGVRDIGLRWAWRDPRLIHARVAHGFTATVGATPVSFSWNTRLARWVRYRDGAVIHQAGGAPVMTPNVIVQFCTLTVDRRDVDVVGHASTDTMTVGSGPALVFRNGRVISARWVRRSPSAQTHYIDGTGRDVALHPGGAWVLLAGTGAHVTLR